MVLESHDLQGRDKIAMTLFWAAVPIYLFSFLFQLVVSQAGTRANASTAPHTNHLPHTVLENLFLNDPEVVCAEALPWEFAPV